MQIQTPVSECYSMFNFIFPSLSLTFREEDKTSDTCMVNRTFFGALFLKTISIYGSVYRVSQSSALIPLEILALRAETREFGLKGNTITLLTFYHWILQFGEAISWVKLTCSGLLEIGKTFWCQVSYHYFCCYYIVSRT